MPEIGLPGPHKTTHQNGGTDEISLTGLSGLLGDSQTPLAHKTSHQDTGTDEISVAGLVGRQIFVPYNGKIADISEADTNKHTLDLATALSETRKIIGGLFGPARVSGSGVMQFFPNEGALTSTWDQWGFNHGMEVIKDGTQRLQYAQSVANDDFDINCYGYVVET